MDELKNIEKILNDANLDIRQTGKREGSRWIDQKCTPDVICAVADIIDTLCHNYGFNPDSFSSEDVWLSHYSREYIPDIFNKPDPTRKDVKSEYNKFFQQPLNLLSYAGILSKFKRGRKNYYKVNDYKAIQYIGISDYKALLFLRIYIKNVLKSSGIYNGFVNFMNNQTVNVFESLKESFIKFCHTYTNMKKDLEPKRIFTKIINILSQEQHKLGTYRGRMSKESISFYGLMYGQKNFRDIFAKKPKDISRKTWLSIHPIEQSQKAKLKLDSNKAKKYVHRMNNEYFNSRSELDDKYSVGEATQMHHMFPAHEFPEISGYIENIIALTASQHLIKAHPENKTTIISSDYLELLLKAKANTIRKSLLNIKIESNYSFNNFDHVLDIGFDDFSVTDDYDSADFYTSMNKINRHYSNII